MRGSYRVSPAFSAAGGHGGKGRRLLAGNNSWWRQPRCAAGICASALLVPALFAPALLHHTAAAPFDLSSLATPVPAAQPRATWVPAARIVVEPEVVPYRAVAPAGSAPAPAAAPVAAPARGGQHESGAAEGVPPTEAGPTTTTKTAPATTTTLVTTTTAPGPLLTLPAALPAALMPALAPLAPAGTGAVTAADSGPASWFHAPDGTCAHRSLPRGTVVTVTRVSTGASTTCVVDDWGPADTSRVIDLSLDTFEILASPDAGVIEVTLAW